MNIKTIGIDARLYSKTGVGVYIRNLIHYIIKTSPHNIRFIIYLLPEDVDKISTDSPLITKQIAPYRWHSFDEQTKFLRLLNSDKLDLMHFTYFSYPVMYSRPFVATIHDTIMLDHKTGRASTKNWFYYQFKHLIFRFVFQSQLTNAFRIITPTQTVKKRLLSIFGAQFESKIFPISEGVSYDLLENSNSEDDMSLPQEYFLYVGNFYPHKNVQNLIEAYVSSDAQVPLLLLGPSDYFLNRLKTLSLRSNTKNRILFKTDLPSSTFHAIYKRARALIHPSLDEGFCLPLLEAAYFNKPILASNIDVFHELLGKEYIPFNPESVASIRDAINDFNKNPKKFDYSSILTARTFKKMTEETIQIYQSAL